MLDVFGPLPRLIGRLTALLGLYAVYVYARAGLTLSHYDAKAHLVVARRIFDSITPGWEQVGAVWLPLPHLLNMLPVQIDLLYRTGGSAIALSVVSHALAAASIAAAIHTITRSTIGAALGAALFAANPNVLYLQSTPMTEPLLIGLVALQVALLTQWVVKQPLEETGAIGWVTLLACLTRYEAWPITACAFAASAIAWWRRGAPLVAVIRAHARLTLYPIVAVAAFMAFSRITVGEWFVSGGFFIPDETLRGQPAVIIEKIIDGTETLGGEWLVRFARVALIAVVLLAIARPDRTAMLIPLALFGAAALPFSAYLSGHPFRIRYEIPLVVASAVAIGLAVSHLGRIRRMAALVVLVVVIQDRPAFDPRAAMVHEAQLDRPNGVGRGVVTSCLRGQYNGGTIMASMGSLGHYMHELSAAGFSIRDFLHEGNGPIWDSAYTRGPAPLVKWVMVEEFAEGGDAIAQRQRTFPRLLEGFVPVCSGGNVTLYRKKE